MVKSLDSIALETLNEVQFNGSLLNKEVRIVFNNGSFIDGTLIAYDSNCYFIQVGKDVILVRKNNINVIANKESEIFNANIVAE